MNGKQLLEAMSGIDEKYIASAEKKPASRKMVWRNVLSAVACLALVATGCLYFSRSILLSRFASHVLEPALDYSCMSIEDTSSAQENQIRIYEEPVHCMAGGADASESAGTSASDCNFTAQIQSYAGDSITVVVIDTGTSSFASGTILNITAADGSDLPEEGFVFITFESIEEASESIIASQVIPVSG